MANAIFYYESIENATLTLNTLDEATGYPKENLQDLNKNTLWKDSTGNHSGYIEIDLGTARACDSLILGQHNYTNTGTGIKLSYGETDDGNFADESYAIGTVGTYHDYTSGDVTIWLETFSSQTKRYWRLYLEDPIDVDSQELGLIYLGTKLSHTVNRNWGMSERRLSNVSSLQTLGGQVYANKNGNIRKVYDLFWEDIQETHKGNIITFIESVENNLNPFYIDLDGDGTELLVRKQGNRGGVTDKDYQVYDSDRLVLIEEI